MCNCECEDDCWNLVDTISGRSNGRWDFVVNEIDWVAVDEGHNVLSLGR